MKDQHQDQIRRSLQDSESTLNESVVKDLEQARKYALQRVTQTNKKTQANKYSPVTAVRFVAASIMLTFGLILVQKFYTNDNAKPTSAMPLLVVSGIDNTDLKTVISEEELEIYEDLDFYVWLVENNRSG